MDNHDKRFSSLKWPAAILIAWSIVAAACAPAEVECVSVDITCSPAILLVRTTSSAAGTNTNASNPWLSYNPTTISGLRVWVKAEGIVQSDSTALASWTDLSGSGNTVTAGNAPTYFSSTAAINGRPIVRFNAASGNFLANNAPTGLSGSDSGSFFIVFRNNSLLNQSVMSIGTCGTQGRQFSLTNNATSLEVNKWCLGQVMNPAVSWPVGVVHQLTVLQNGAVTIVLRLDGTQIGNAVPALTGYGPGALNIGGTAYADIAEVLYFDNRISDANATNVECYLGARYATHTCP